MGIAGDRCGDGLRFMVYFKQAIKSGTGEYTSNSGFDAERQVSAKAAY